MLQCASMRGRSSQNKCITALLLVVVALSWVLPVHGSFCGTPRNHSRPKVPAELNLPVAYDLDNDLRADYLSLLSNGFDKTIQIRFGNARNRKLTFTSVSANPGTLLADDIDHDGDLDLIWLASLDQKTAVVWINDGSGDFSEAADSAQYGAELNRVISESDSPDPHTLQASRSTSPFAQSSADILFTVTSQLSLAPTPLAC